MKFRKLPQILCTVGLASACAFGLASCGSDEDLGLVAATVNGEPIYEDTITEYIEAFRSSYSLEDDDAWGEWLASSGYTPETVREDVIEYYVSQELLRQAADEYGVTIDESEIDTIVETMKSYYDSDEAWEEALATVGTTEEAYREALELSMIEEALEEAVVSVDDPTDDEVLEALATYFSGTSKRSSHILVDDEETAQEVYELVTSGEMTFEEAAAEYSTDSSADDGGDVGWDTLSSFVDEYQTALDELSVGEISEPVESDYGWHIIECTDEFDADGAESADDIPSEISETLISMLVSQAESAAYSEWYTEYEESAEIVINDMPEGLSYDIDMTAYTESDDEEDSDDTTDDSTDDTSDDTTDESTEDDTTDDSTSDESTDESTDADDGSSDDSDSSSE